MTRWGLAFTVLVALALVAMVASAFYDSSTVETGGAYAAQVGTIGADWVHIEWYQDSAGGLHYVVVTATVQPPPTATATPAPTLTPLPTNTPRASATATTRPTSTPEASATPVYTLTPEYTPSSAPQTPTPETALPTPAPTDTPAPWPTSTPSADVCTGTPATNWFIRSGPGSTYDKLAYFAASDNPTSTPPAVGVQTFRLIASANGYYAFWLSESAVAWTAAGAWTLAGQCDALPAEVVGGYRTGPAALLWHYVPGGNIMELTAAGQIAASNGRPWGALVVDDPGACVQIEAAGGTCIARSNHAGDCPRLDLPPADSATEYLNRNAWYATVSGASLYAVYNECNIEAASWWNMLILATVKQAAAMNYPPLVVGNFLAHEPSEDWLRVTAEAWHAVRVYRGYLGMHAYSYFDDTWLCSPSQWMPTDRDKLVRSVLEAVGVPGIQMIYTEVAAGRGDRPVSAQTVSDATCWFHKADERRAVWGGALWTSGQVGTMPADATLDGHMVEIARAVG